MSSFGRVTLPIQEGLDEAIPEIMRRLGADAVRNSDGTALPADVTALGAKVYATYFVGRGDQNWASAHPHHRTQVYLMSPRVVAPADGPLAIEVMAQWFAQQVEPDLDCDVNRWWQVIDRTTGRTLDPAEWSVSGTGAHTNVHVARPEPFHIYTVGFLAYQSWDPTQMYNYVTNGWADDPTRVKEQPYDVRHPQTWAHVRAGFERWLAEHPEVDVVRFTTFFYHFTLVYGPDAKERFVDWFGYTGSVSVPALEAFEAETGLRPTAEDFVDQGYYQNTFRTPSAIFRAWIDFQNRFVTDRVADLVAMAHAAGKEAMMFLGDNWIGTEPYGDRFARTGMDAVVGSVGSAASCRIISDIPGVRYTEGRFLPYLFPDVFNPDGDPAGEAREAWVTARRAIVRSPLDRIGYGGYLSLALAHPDFLAQAEAICAEFRDLHDRSQGERPQRAPVTVAVLNQWGKLRSWQTHMVAHALWYRQTYSYLGVLEALAGLPFEVRFLSFDDVRDGVPEDVHVLVNAGSAGTAFSGAAAWLDPRVQTSVRRFVAAGGGFVGVGEPTAAASAGAVFQLGDVLGVEQETGWTLSNTRHPQVQPAHFVTAGLPAELDVGEGTREVYPIGDSTQVLRLGDGQVHLAVNAYAAGRSVYLAGLPYSPVNARLLHRALYWAAGQEDRIADLGWANDPRVEIAWYPGARRALVCNVTLEEVATQVHVPAAANPVFIEIGPGGQAWVEVETKS